MKFADAIKEQMDKQPEYVFLKITSKLEDFKDKDIADSLRDLYNPVGYNKRDTLNLKLMACFLNAIFTQGRYVFMNSQRAFVKLIQQDRYLKRSSLNGQEYDAFIHFLKLNKHIEDVRSATFNKAGVYRISSQIIRTSLELLINKELERSQEAQCIEMYDNYVKLPTKLRAELLTKTSPVIVNVTATELGESMFLKKEVVVKNSEKKENFEDKFYEPVKLLLKKKIDTRIDNLLKEKIITFGKVIDQRKADSMNKDISQKIKEATDFVSVYGPDVLPVSVLYSLVDIVSNDNPHFKNKIAPIYIKRIQQIYTLMESAYKEKQK